MLSNQSPQKLEAQAELVAWYVVCESISYQHKDMRDEAIVFKKYLDIKKTEVMKYPAEDREVLLNKVRSKADILIDKRFIIASCKEFYKYLKLI